MTPGEIKEWTAIVLALLSIAGMLWMWLTRGTNENRQEIRSLEDRVTKIETHQEHAPAKDEVHKLAESLAHLNGEVGKMTVQLQMVNGTVARIDQHLMDARQ